MSQKNKKIKLPTKKAPTETIDLFINKVTLVKFYPHRKFGK